MLQQISNTPANQLLADWEQFKFGFDRHTAGQPIFACTSDEQRRGWCAALRDEAVANLPATCADRLGF